MSCSILATWPYGSSLMKACKKQKLDKPGQQSIGGSKKDSSIFKLPEMLKSCSVLGYSDYVLPRSNISAIHVDTVRRCNGKRTIACNLWNSYSSWCFLRRIHWKTPKRRRMHQSRSRRHLENSSGVTKSVFWRVKSSLGCLNRPTLGSLGLSCERVIMGHSFLSAQTHVNKMEELKRR